MKPIELYKRDGFYIHSESILAPGTVEAASRGLEQVRAGIYDTGEEPDGRAWNPGDDPLKLCKIEHPQIANWGLRAALAAPGLGQLAGALTGANMVQVWWVQGLYKPGSSGAVTDSKVGWHQDQHYWTEWEEESEVFTAWLALSDVTPDSGPMVFVPGSHKWGLSDAGNFFGQDQNAIRNAVKVPEGEVWHEVQDVLPPGGVSFHHKTLFHGSHLNISDRPRLSLAIHLRTEKSKIRPESGFARYLNRPEICPVIFEV